MIFIVLYFLLRFAVVVWWWWWNDLSGDFLGGLDNFGVVCLGALLGHVWCVFFDDFSLDRFFWKAWKETLTLEMLMILKVKLTSIDDRLDDLSFFAILGDDFGDARRLDGWSLIFLLLLCFGGRGWNVLDDDCGWLALLARSDDRRILNILHNLVGDFALSDWSLSTMKMSKKTKSLSFELNNTWVSVSRYWWAARRIYKFARILNRIESPRRHKKIMKKMYNGTKKRRKGEFKPDAKHFHNNCSRSCLRNRQKRSTQKHFSASIPTTVERGKKRGIFTFLFLLGVLNKAPNDRANGKNWKLCVFHKEMKRRCFARARRKCSLLGTLKKRWWKKKDMCMYNNERVYKSTPRTKWRYFNTAKINDRFYVNYAFFTSGFYFDSIKTCASSVCKRFPIKLNEVIPGIGDWKDAFVSHYRENFFFLAKTRGIHVFHRELHCYQVLTLFLLRLDPFLMCFYFK